MTDSSDLIKLYSKRILALAASIPLTERLDAPCGSAKRRSPLCGSVVTVDVTISGNHVTAYGQDVKACALGQASASIVGANVVGLSFEDIAKGQHQLKEMLTENGPVPDAPFDGFDVLEPAREYKNRHASIMLAFDATMDAITAANKKQCA